MNKQEPIIINSYLSYEVDPTRVIDFIRSSRIAELEELTDALFLSFPLAIKRMLNKKHYKLTRELRLISQIKLVGRGNVNNPFDFDGIEDVLSTLEVDLNDPTFKIHRDSLVIYIKLKCISFQFTHQHTTLKEQELFLLYEQAKSIFPEALDSNAEQMGIKSTKSKAALAKHKSDQKYKNHVFEMSKVKGWIWDDSTKAPVKKERWNTIVEEYKYKGCTIKKNKNDKKYYFYTRKKGHFLAFPNPTNLAKLFRNNK